MFRVDSPLAFLVYNIHFLDKYVQLVTVTSCADLVIFSLGMNAKVDVCDPVIAST